MSQLDEEYLNNFLPRLEALTQTGKIALIKTDDGSIILAEKWHYPERKETDPENEYEIYPLAKLLTQDEVGELKFEGQTPEVK